MDAVGLEHILAGGGSLGITIVLAGMAKEIMIEKIRAYRNGSGDRRETDPLIHELVQHLEENSCGFNGVATKELESISDGIGKLLSKQSRTNELLSEIKGALNAPRNL